MMILIWKTNLMISIQMRKTIIPLTTADRLVRVATAVRWIEGQGAAVPQDGMTATAALIVEEAAKVDLVVKEWAIMIPGEAKIAPAVTVPIAQDPISGVGNKEARVGAKTAVVHPKVWEAGAIVTNIAAAARGSMAAEVDTDRVSARVTMATRDMVAAVNMVVNTTRDNMADNMVAPNHSEK